MSILKMKKIRLLVSRSEKDELLKELTKQGCVEFSEFEDEIKTLDCAASLTRENGRLLAFRAEQNALNAAVETLNKYAPVKKGMLTAKPEITGDELLECPFKAEALETAAAISAAEDRIKRISSEESRLRGVIDSLVPWLSLDLPLDTAGTGRAAVVLGTVPARVEFETVRSAAASVTEEAELFEVSCDKEQRYLVLVCIKEQLAQVLDALRAAGFSSAAVSGMSGTARECTSASTEALKTLAAEKTAAENSIKALAGEREKLSVASDAVGSEMARAEAEEKLLGMNSIVAMRGWMPAEKEEALAAIFEKHECAWESEDPTEDEYPDVPVKLKNNFLSNGLNMVTEMYSLPAYGSVDPNPLMAPFFILFYGLMMADMGYGLLMIIAAAVAMIKIKPREGSLSFCQLLLWGGISTFICGALTGGFFGDALVKIGELTGKPAGWGELPYLFSPLNNTLEILIGAMILGFIHLNTGMVINVVKKVKRHQVADAIWEEGALWVTLLGIILYVFKLGNIAGVPVVLVIGLVMVFYGGSRSAKGFGKVTSIFGTLYNTATGWFGDILSYSRIMALMLAGSVIAQVFNTIGAIANNLIFFIIIFIIGHALNFGLNLLGCYVHDLRLQCLEYFGKFYEDGGRAFAPLRFKTKYYNIKE